MAEAVGFDDVWELWRAEAVHMQNLASQYGESATALHRTALSQDQAFEGAATELPAAFANLRNTLQDQILVVSRENLTKSGNALAGIATAFAERDGMNGRLIEKIDGLDDAGTNPDDRPPAYVPEAPSSDDPHPEHQPNPAGGY